MKYYAVIDTNVIVSAMLKWTWSLMKTNIFCYHSILILLRHIIASSKKWNTYVIVL